MGAAASLSHHKPPPKGQTCSLTIQQGKRRKRPYKKNCGFRYVCKQRHEARVYPFYFWRFHRTQFRLSLLRKTTQCQSARVCVRHPMWLVPDEAQAGRSCRELGSHVSLGLLKLQALSHGLELSPTSPMWRPSTYVPLLGGLCIRQAGARLRRAPP